MNLLYGQIVEIALEDRMRVGKIRVAGALKKISLELVEEAQVGYRVLVCDGIALSQVDPVEPPSLSQQLCNTRTLHYSNTPSADLQAPNVASNKPGPNIF
jgi:hydrogenase maturation factor